MRGRRLWIIFLALCCLPVAVFFLSFNLFSDLDNSQADYVDLVLGKQRIRADRSYSKWVEFPPGAYVEEVIYRGLLPKILSKTVVEYQKLFDGPDPDEIIIMVRRLSPSWNNRSAVKRIRGLSEHAGEAAVPNLFRTDYDDDPVKDLFYDRSENGRVLWFAECERLEDEPAPVCVAAERHFTDIGVSYKFDRTWLTDWQQIRRNVIAFVEARLLP